MSLRTEIRDRIIAALNADVPTGIPQATKRRWLPGSQITEPRVSVIFLDELVEQSAGGRNSPVVRRSLVYGVQVVAGAHEPDFSDDLIEPVLAHVVDALGDTNLGGYATGVFELGTQWQTSETGTARFVIAAMNRWRVDFQTKRNDLAAKQ